MADAPLRKATSKSGPLEVVVKITGRSWHPKAAGRRAVEKHGDALRRLSDDPEEGDSLTVIARTLGSCTQHAAHKHGCQWCREAELQVARATGTKTMDVVHHQLAGAVKDFEGLREMLQNVLDAGFNYPEEYRDSLQETLDAYPTRGGQSPEPCQRVSVVPIEGGAWGGAGVHGEEAERIARACGGSVPVDPEQARREASDDDDRDGMVCT